MAIEIIRYYILINSGLSPIATYYYAYYYYVATSLSLILPFLLFSIG